MCMVLNDDQAIRCALFLPENKRTNGENNVCMLTKEKENSMMAMYHEMKDKEENECTYYSSYD